MVISLFLMMRSLETAEWWKEVINKGAFLLVGLSFIFAGINLWMTAKKRLKEREISEKIRSLWKLLKDQGKMKMEEIATHLGIPRADVPAWIYRLGASEAFTGYVDWKDGVLYSVEAGLLGEGKDCPQCGGRLELAKKGIFQCQHCGTEVFLKK
jgi:transcription initiation factor IIE alpha subunit